MQIKGKTSGCTAGSKTSPRTATANLNFQVRKKKKKYPSHKNSVHDIFHLGDCAE